MLKNIDNKIETLKKLGMAENEAEIYLVLLKTGGATATILAKSLDLQRTSVYHTLTKMTRQKFIQVYYEKNKKFFKPIKPYNLANLFKRNLESFNNLIPNLDIAQKRANQQAGLRFIQTIEELKEFYLQILEDYKGQSYKIIGDAASWENLDSNFFIDFRIKRGKANIKTKLLLTNESKSINPKDKSLQRIVKFLPEKYSFKSTIDIYDDKILIVGSDISAVGVVIEVPAMVDVFKETFNILWEVFS